MRSAGSSRNTLLTAIHANVLTAHSTERRKLGEAGLAGRLFVDPALFSLAPRTRRECASVNLSVENCTDAKSLRSSVVGDGARRS